MVYLYLFSIHVNTNILYILLLSDRLIASNIQVCVYIIYLCVVNRFESTDY